VALKNCLQCDHEVSGAAAICPSCSHPLKKQKKPLVSRPLRIFLQLTAAGVLFAEVMRYADGNISGAISMGIIGLFLLYVGGRTKARL
jgi:hypothetical protein